MSDLKGKRIVITGASSGIGEALAYALAERGAQLVLASRNETELRRVQNNCQRSADHHIKVMDLANLSSLEGELEEIWNDFGPIDILVNNAGISHRYRAQEASLEIDQKIMAINFFGTIALTKPTLKRMLDRSCGQIVCVSSLVGLLGVKNRTIYSASKHALRGYFESLRHELHQSPIKITMVYPGYIDTNMPQNALLKSGLPNALQEKTHLDGMKAEDCASQIVKAIEKELPEIIVARPLERAAVFVSQHLPGLFRWLFPRLYR